MTQRVYPDKVPGIVAILGWDGEDFRVIKVDEDHHIQADVLSTVLPTDAATQTTLAALLTELGAKLETADLNIEAVSKDLQVDVVSSALPSGAATETSLDEVMDRLGDETSPATGSVNKQLADIHGEVQKHTILDRSPNIVTIAGGGSYAAHAVTLRHTYTVPGGKKALIQILYSTSTLPSAGKFTRVYMLLGDSLIFNIYCESTYNMMESWKLQIESLLAISGEELKVYTQSNSVTNEGIYFKLRIMEFT